MRNVFVPLLVIQYLCLFQTIVAAHGSDDDIVRSSCYAQNAPTALYAGKSDTLKKTPSVPRKLAAIDKMKQVGKAAAVGVAGAFIASSTGTGAGFTVAGIAKGSLAAAFHAKFGTGLAFSALQSLGATGGMTVLGPVGLAGGALAMIVYLLV